MCSTRRRALWALGSGDISLCASPTTGRDHLTCCPNGPCRPAASRGASGGSATGANRDDGRVSTEPVDVVRSPSVVSVASFSGAAAAFLMAAFGRAGGDDGDASAGGSRLDFGRSGRTLPHRERPRRATRTPHPNLCCGKFLARVRAPENR